jgi:hypothetical protein
MYIVYYGGSYYQHGINVAPNTASLQLATYRHTLKQVQWLQNFWLVKYSSQKLRVSHLYDSIMFHCVPPLPLPPLIR